ATSARSSPVRRTPRAEALEMRQAPRTGVRPRLRKSVHSPQENASAPSPPADAGDPVITIGCDWNEFGFVPPNRTYDCILHIFLAQEDLADQQPVRFNSRSAACFTFALALGYLRVISPSVAQAASFSFNAASDWPSRNSESGALAEDSCLVETLRKDYAASRSR